MAIRRCTRLGYLSALACALGCLPAGDPPPGRHLVTDRTLSAVQFSASEQDGVPAYLLVSGPVHTEDAPDADASASLPQTDLYWIQGATSDETGALPRALAKGHPLLSKTPQDDPVLADSLGRLVVEHRDPDKPADPAAFQISRFDLATKTVVHLTSVNRSPKVTRQPVLRLSPERTRVVIDSGNLELFELENQRSWVETDGRWQFWGEDIYFSNYDYLVRGSVISRLKPHAAAEAIVSKAELAYVFPFLPDSATVAETRVLYQSPDAFSVIDPDSRTVTDLPFLMNFTLSPSGNWITGISESHQVAFGNWAENRIASASVLPLHPPEAHWRPGHDEYWSRASDGNLYIWQPTGLRVIEGLFVSFSDDGRFWFASEESSSGSLQWTVGAADSPEGPRYPTNPPDTSAFFKGSVAGNWVITTLWLDAAGTRFDFTIVDPTTGQSQTLAVKGRLVATSPTRALAYANWDDGHKSGELALFDLASGAKTVLANGVYAAAVDPGFHSVPQPNTDRLAPGTRVAFLVRERFASPYDGLWVTELP